MPDNESTMKWKVDITQLKAAMQDAKRSISLANAEFKTATAGMDKWQNSTTGLEAKLKQLNSTLPQQRSILAQLEQQYDLTAENMGENSAEAQRLKIQIENQKAAIAKTEASIDTYNGKLNDMKAAESSLTNIISKQEAELSDLKTAYVDAVAQYGKNSTEAKNLASQISSLSGELSKNKTSMDEAEKAADGFDKTIDKAGKETKDAGNEAKDASGKFEGLGTAMLNAAKVGIAAFAAAIAGAVTGLTSASVEAASYGDEMMTLSTVTGMSTESLQAYNYAAELVDVSMETLTGSMARNIRSMSSAASGTGAAAEAYARLGISVTDSNGNLRDGETVYWETIDALSEMEEGTERDALAMQLFGKSAQELNPLIEQGSEGIAELTDEARAMGAVLSDDQLADLGAFDDSIQRLQAGAGAARNALGLILLPTLQSLADEGVSLLGEFTSGLIEADGDWTQISAVIGNTVESLASTVLEQLPNVISVGTSMVSALGSAIVNNIPTLVSAAGRAVVQLVTAFASAAPRMTNAGWQAATALVLGLAQAAPQLIAAIPPMVTGILDAIMANLPLLLDAGMELIQALLDGVMEAFPLLLDYIPVLIQNVCDFINENLPAVLETGVQLLIELANGILNAIPTLIRMLPTIITTIVTVLMNNLPVILNAGVQLLLGLINGLVTAIPELISMLPTIITTIVTVLTENLPTIIQMGMTTLVSLIQGLTEAIPQLIEMLPQITQTIIQILTENLPLILQMGVEILFELIAGLANALPDLGLMMVEIGAAILDSLAEVVSQMFDIGSNIVSGIWEGISAGYDWICNKISGWVGSVTDYIRSAFGIASPSKLMRDMVGKWLPEGIAVGFEADMPSALKQMKKTMNNALSDLKTDVALKSDGLIGDVSVVSGSGSRSSDVNRPSVVNFNQTINSPKAVDGMTLYRQTNSLLFSAEVRLGNV